MSELKGFTPPRSPAGRAAMLPPPPWTLQGAGWVAHWTEPKDEIGRWVAGPGEPTGRVMLTLMRWTFVAEKRESADAALTECLEAALGFEMESKALGEADGDGDGAAEAAAGSPFTFWTHSWSDRDWMMALRWLTGVAAKVGAFTLAANFTAGPGLMKLSRDGEPVLRINATGDNPKSTNLPGLKLARGRRFLPDPLLESGDAPLLDDIVEEVRSDVHLAQAGSQLAVLKLQSAANEDFGSLGDRPIPVSLEQVRLGYRFERLKSVD